MLASRLKVDSKPSWGVMLIAIVALVALVIAGNPGPAEADHFRYGHYNWHPAGGTTIDFSLQDAFTRDQYGSDCVNTVTLMPIPCTGPGGFPGVGDVIAEFEGFTTLHPGDLTIIGSPIGPLLYLVTSIDVANNWFLATALDPDSLPLIDTAITHTYAAPGNYNAFIDNFSRIMAYHAPNAHINNPNGEYRLESIVNVGTGNNSPVSAMSSIVVCPTDPIIDTVCSFPVQASDPNGDPLHFRLSTFGEWGGVQPGVGTAPNVATIDPNTGIYTWNTRAARLIPFGMESNPPPAGTNVLYSTQVTIEDGTSKVVVDFLIQLVPYVAPNEPPRFDMPPSPCGQTATVTVGATVTFTVQASDPDTGDIVTLSVVGTLPPGATMMPPLPAMGNPVSSTFTWVTNTPGAFPVTFRAEDRAHAQAECVVTIVVNPVVVPPPISQEGRMTGGGGLTLADGTKVRHGFALECDLAEPPHNMVVTWGSGNKFKLDAPTSALCTVDPTISSGNPTAGFNTYEGSGTGQYNGQPGATAHWKFTDAGEPGKNDTMEIEITYMGTVVLTVPPASKLTQGNHQAH